MILRLIRGLPGSGKSTFAKTFDCFHIEADMFCINDDKYLFSQLKHKRRHRYAQLLCKFMLTRGCDVVVANTFTKLSELEPYLDIADEITNKVTVQVYRMNNNFGSTHNVPIEKIDEMKKRFEDYQDEIIVTKKQEV